MGLSEEFKCHYVIFEQVIPEIIINMRRAAVWTSEEVKVFSIVRKNNYLEFENNFGSELHHYGNIDREKRDSTQNKKTISGKEMCNNILKELGLCIKWDRIGNKHITKVQLTTNKKKSL